MLSESLTKDQRTIIASHKARGQPPPSFYRGDPEPISEWEEYLRTAFVRLHTDRPDPMMPIPHRHIVAYAEREGFTGEDRELFVDVIMHVDQAFLKRDETEMEPESKTIDVGGERMPVNREALGWSTLKSGSSSTQRVPDGAYVGSNKA